jgi:ribosomal protein L14
MIMIESKVKSADNAGGIFSKCITIFGGYKRRYAKLGELIGIVSHSRKVYKHQTNKQKLAKLAKKMKKKRKIKSKKKRQPNMRPYLGLLIALKKRTKRPDGVYLKFDENRLMTFTEPTKFGPAGKTENIPNFIGTKSTGPAPLELVKNKVIRARFKKAISMAGGIV